MAAFPDWNDLRDILLITEAGTLSAAARAAGVSQSTMSRRLAAIEATGQPVFLRDETGRMTPNARGRDMVAAATEMRAVYDRLRLRLTDAPPPLRIATCESAARLFLSQALPVWSGRAETPAEMHVIEDVPALAVYDVLVGVMPAVPEHCVGQSIGRVEWGLYAAPSYVASNRIRGRLASLEGQSVIRASGALAETTAYRWLGRQGGVIALMTGAPTAMIEGCAAGMGIALLPVALAETDARLLPIDGPRPAPSEVWMIADAARAEEPQIAGFFRWARNHFRNHAPADRRAG
ncbi:LysR family transcriptional regulator [Paragemmobacter straminiformis]|uniref:LysR family transcriptional regulator n=1 Tax=Paragemmobacter straminiformis TaxID=2045119 RepID=A0A842I6Q6_9RHOB|nr:LysR family transcriptional regulator [Gemmobacter straminiformis]MBC2835520.1 LysR family transcriptional regulator [Gemmobacter straminiformis]